MFCRNCGKELPDGAKFCGGCGKSLTTEAGQAPKMQSATRVEQPTSKKEEKKSKNGLGLLIVLLCFALCVGVLVWLGIKVWLNNDSDNEKEDTQIEENLTEEDSDDEESDGAEKDYAEATMAPVTTEAPAVTEAPVATEVPVATQAPVATAEPAVIHEYGFYIEDTTWTEANQKCRDMGGYLVNIDSQEEYEYIIETMEAYGCGNIIWWLGACRQNNTFEYNWILPNGNLSEEIINKTDLYDEFWMAGEPSYYGGDMPELYLNMFYSSGEGRYVWNDVPDDVISVVASYSGKIGYICEFDSGQAPAAPTVQSSYILPTSNSEYLDLSDLIGLTQEECRIARNEIFARHGRMFSDEGLQAYFNACNWYNGTILPENFNDSVLNEYEVANRDLIVEYEEMMGYR